MTDLPLTHIDTRMPAMLVAAANDDECFVDQDIWRGLGFGMPFALMIWGMCAAWLFGWSWL